MLGDVHGDVRKWRAVDEPLLQGIAMPSVRAERFTERGLQYVQLLVESTHMGRDAFVEWETESGLCIAVSPLVARRLVRQLERALSHSTSIDHARPQPRSDATVTRRKSTHRSGSR